MTVSKSSLSTTAGGTSSEPSIASGRARRGDLRRLDIGSQRGADRAGDVDAASRSGSAGQLTVRLVGRVGGARPGRKVCTLVATILAGGSHIDHADMLRAGATEAVLPFRVMNNARNGTTKTPNRLTKVAPTRTQKGRGRRCS